MRRLVFNSPGEWGNLEPGQRVCRRVDENTGLGMQTMRERKEARVAPEFGLEHLGECWSCSQKWGRLGGTGLLLLCLEEARDPDVSV